MACSNIGLKGSKLLVVDDKKENLELMTNILESEGFEVAFALDGEKAIKIAHLFLPDLILLDVMMPGIDGFETCRRLKSLADVKDIPVIFVTAKTQIEDVVAAFCAGAVDYVTKPIRREELLARVNTHLELRKLIILRDTLIGQLRDYNVELAELSALKTVQLEESERMSHLAEIVGEMSHELGTPLGITNTAISSMKEKLDALESSFRSNALSKESLADFISYNKECMTLCSTSMTYANKLVSSFKDIVVGEFNESASLVNLETFLDDIKLILTPKIKRSNHVLQIECPHHIEVFTRSGALSQVLINLVNNSLLHAFDEGQAGNIVIRVEKHRNSISLDVFDNGKGMEQSLIDRIFDKYFTTKSGRGGSGLGLFIVKKLVEEKLQGRLALESKLTEGTRFSITVPISLAPTPDDANENCSP